MGKSNEHNEHDEWIRKRKKGIGASDAACILGLNPWKTNKQLWMEKTGREKPDDISEKDNVKYGVAAEPLLREIFKIDFPSYDVYYEQFGMFRNEQYPWLFATLDGWFRTDLGEMGVLEIKTTEIMRNSQWKKWKDGIPDYYYVQVLHQLLATDFDFAILKAQIKYTSKGNPCSSTRHYTIRRDDEQVMEDMEMVLEKEVEFWNQVQNNVEPGLILPEI